MAMHTMSSVAWRFLLPLTFTLVLDVRGEAGGLRGAVAPQVVTSGAAAELDASHLHNVSNVTAELLPGALGSLNQSALAALQANMTNVTSLVAWNMNRCRRYPWELQCLDANRICPYMPWMPQCRDQPPPTEEPTEPTVAPRPPSGNVMKLYHQTSPEIAALILQGGFKPGREGWCGGGIYFAVTPKATYKKAIGPDSHLGEIIEAEVDLGKVKRMPAWCDRKMTGNTLSWMGYDSVKFNPGDGDEYVVYSPDRVISTQKWVG